MGTVAVEVVIERPVAEVFTFAADQRHRARLLPDNFTDVRLLTPHSTGLGVRLAFTIHMDRGSYESVSEIIVYDPPRTFTERTTDAAAVYETDWRFTSAAAGTRVTLATRYPDPPTRIARLLDRLAGRRMLRQSLLVELLRLKLALEEP